MRLLFSKALGSLVVANFVTLVVFNALHLKTSWVMGLYPLFMLLSAYAFCYLIPRKRCVNHDWVIWGLLVSTFVLLTLPRLSYLFDMIPSVFSGLCWDDESRIGHLISMVNSPDYPLRHFANQTYALSYYYSSYFPWVAIKLWVPIISLKALISIGNMLYHILILGTIAELSVYWFSKLRSRRVFIGLLTLFSGLDWIFSLDRLISHAEWWQKSMFHANTSISTFFNAYFWAVHHSVGFVSVLLGIALFFNTRTRYPHLKLSLCLLLLASGFFMSPFSVIAFPLYALYHWKLIRRNILFTWPMLIVVLMSLIPLPIFMNKPQSVTCVPSTFRLIFSDHFFLDKVLSLPLYMTLVPIIEFCGIPIALCWVYKTMSRAHRHYFLVSWLFFFTTYIIAMSGWNIISMRGMFLPTCMFYYLFAYYLNHFNKRFITCLITLILLCSLVGTLRESADRMRRSIGASTWLFQCFPSMQQYASYPRTKDSVFLAQHPDWVTKVKTTNTPVLPTVSPYNAEQFRNVPFSEMKILEFEALGYRK